MQNNILKNKGYNLSHEPNTPQYRLLLAKAMGQKGVRNVWEFETSWGHIVTKILDLCNQSALTYQTNAYEEVDPFADKSDIMQFFGLSEEDLSKQPQLAHMERKLSGLYRQKFKDLDAPMLLESVAAAQSFLQAELGMPSTEPLKIVDVRQKLITLHGNNPFFATAGRLSEDLEIDLLCAADMYGISWEDIAEETMSPKQQLAFCDGLVHALVRFPEGKRVQEQMARIQGEVMRLIKIDQEQIKEVRAAGNDFLARRKSGFVSWKTTITDTVWSVGDDGTLYIENEE